MELGDSGWKAGAPQRLMSNVGQRPFSVFSPESRRRNELIYLSPDDHLMVVSYTAEGNTFRASPPQTWSERPINSLVGPRKFALHPDGDRVVVGGGVASAARVDKIVLVTNVFDEVRRLSDSSR